MLDGICPWPSPACDSPRAGAFDHVCTKMEHMSGLLQSNAILFKLLEETGKALKWRVSTG